jgi:hypothetical protein
MLNGLHTVGRNIAREGALGASLHSEDQISDSGDTDCCISVSALRSFYCPIRRGGTERLESHMWQVTRSCVFETYLSLGNSPPS